MFTVFKCVSFCNVVEEAAGHFPSITVLLFLSSVCEAANVSPPRGYHKILAGFG